MRYRILDRSPTMAAVVSAASLECSYVMLGHARFSLIDKSDLVLASGRTWGMNKNGYAVNQSEDGAVFLHKVVLGAAVGQEVDHENRQKLDNRKFNLRFCTRSQNNANSVRRKNNQTSRFKGVRHMAGKNFFIARGSCNRVRFYLGTFKDDVSAAKAYNAWAIQKFGKFARLNEL